jgi:cytochrome c biogenesis protein CcdA
VIVPYAAAAVCSYLDRGERPRLAVAAGVVVLGLGALAAFFIANPYSVLDYTSFHGELVHQSTLSAESQGKLGAPKNGGLIYYLWSLTWGLGWVPALAALAGAVTVWRRDRRLGWLLVPAPLIFLAFMGTEGRYFGRWLMPILPILCLLAAFFAIQAIAQLARAVRARAGSSEQPRGRSGRAGAAVIAGAALAVVLLLGQGLTYSVHSGLVLARADTRTLTRAWMLANIPAGSKIVAEPVSPDQWALEAPGAGTTEYCRPYKDFRWCKWPSEFSYLNARGELEGKVKPHKLGIEDYERTLAPSLIGYYESKGFCWVVSGSTESGRAEADPAAVPAAIAYYRALEREATVVYRASPYSTGKGPVAFDFDWSFDYYPLAYHRPGPVMTIYRLHGGRCSS